MSGICGLCAKGGVNHCGWCQCCAANQTGNVGGGRSPMAGEQRARRGGCLMGLPRPVLLILDHIARRSPAYQAAGFGRRYPWR